MANPACPLCGCTTMASLSAKAARCSRCDLMVNLEAAPLDYSDGGGQAVPDGSKMRWRLANAKRRFVIMKPWLSGVEVFVDIGCGSGEMLETAADYFKYRIGFDTNRPLIEHIRKSGHAIAVEGHFDPAALPATIAGKGALYAVSHVLEHLANPMALVSQIASAMRSGDLLYIEVPMHTGRSFQTLGYNWSLWNSEHLMLFSAKSLEFLAKQSGLVTLAQGARIFARGSHSSKLRLRLLRENPRGFLTTALRKPRNLSIADIMVADYGYCLLRRD